MFTFICSQCSWEKELDDSLMDRKVICPKCKTKQRASVKVSTKTSPKPPIKPKTPIKPPSKQPRVDRFLAGVLTFLVVSTLVVLGSLLAFLQPEKEVAKQQVEVEVEVKPPAAKPKPAKKKEPVVWQPPSDKFEKWISFTPTRSMKTLPVGFEGHNPSAISSDLTSLSLELYDKEKEKPPRFETKKEKEAREKKLKQQVYSKSRKILLDGNKTLGDVFVYVKKGASYDAENEELKIGAVGSIPYSGSSDSESYIGENLFGAKRKITVNKSHRRVLHQDNNFSVDISIPMTRAVARQSFDDLRVAYMFRVVAPYTDYSSSGGTPSMTKTWVTERSTSMIKVKFLDCWLFNLKTGEVLLKASEHGVPTPEQVAEQAMVRYKKYLKLDEESERSRSSSIRSYHRVRSFKFRNNVVTVKLTGLDFGERTKAELQMKWDGTKWEKIKKSESTVNYNNEWEAEDFPHIHSSYKLEEYLNEAVQYPFPGLAR